MARAWPNLQYCAFDVVFWSRFDLLEATREVLLQAVGVGKSASSYKIVVGGMFGMGGEDLTKIGPKKSNHPNCKDPISAKSKPMIEEVNMISIVVQESLALLPAVSDENAVSIVFCGVQSEGDCESLDTLSANSENTVVIWSCPKDSFGENSEPGSLDFDRGSITVCGQQFGHALMNIASEIGRLRLVVIDADVPSTSVIDIANALTRVPFRSDDSLIVDDLLIILPKLNRIGAYFLEICRLNLFDDLLRVGVVSMDQVSALESELGYLTIGNPLFLVQLVGVLKNISERARVTATLVSMKSSPVQLQSSYSPHHYTMFDYDETHGMNQYAEQMPVGKQTLLQMNVKNAAISNELLETRTQDFLRSMNVTHAELSFHTVGDGIILYAVFVDGHMVTVWDGRQNIDVNIFSYNETIPHKNLFEEYFMKPINSISTLTLWEEQPRGVGRVINFSKDVIAIPGCVDRYMLCDKLEELGECDVEAEKRWMFTNCPLACDHCPENEKSN
eukprot:CAMPEP_0172327290 /NCGR_PEP_ID=MMETSP1058-20130122/59156_1 /TAXON_ID=83371 /ORGANISM="Detonula confervacea, Strain CCMP 353" /LENGTH=503 /DNA_ID=CAMNT_0013044297 /DNA_START=135 /DNA_END=1646 /DNA_ORIENTATION=+